MRRHLRVSGLFTVLATSLALVLAISVSSLAHKSRGWGAQIAARRFPVIGCDRLPNGFHHELQRYAPHDLCEMGGPLSTLSGIDRVRWRGWGRSVAHGRGYLVDGLGFEYPATITVYGVRSCNQCHGVTHYSYYHWLRARSRGGVAGGARRGPFEVRIDATPGHTG